MSTLQHLSLPPHHGAAMSSTTTTGSGSPPKAMTIPEILTKVLTFVVTAEPIPPDPLRDRLYVTKSTLSKQSLINLQSILLVCKQWHEVATRIHLWPIVWSNRTATPADWWEKALDISALGRHQRLVCFFEGQALVRDSIWSKKYAWKDENHSFWIQWLGDMRRVQEQHHLAQLPGESIALTQQQPPLIVDAASGNERVESVGNDRDTPSLTGNNQRPRLNIKELVLTGHFEVHTHVIPLLILPGIADHITLLELRFHHYTILDPRLFFQVVADDEEASNNVDSESANNYRHYQDLPPIPNLRHLILGKVQLRESTALTHWTPRQPSLLQTLSLDCMADPRLTAEFLAGVCGPQTTTLQLYSLPLIPSSNDTPQSNLAPWVTAPQSNVLPVPSSTLAHPRRQQQQPQFKSTIDLLLHLSTRAPNIARISIESVNTVQTLLTLSQAFPRVELIENYVSRYTRARKILSSSPSALSHPPPPLDRSIPMHPPLQTPYFLTSIKIPIWRGGNVEAGRNLDDLLVMDATGIGVGLSASMAGSACLIPKQLVDPEWDWFHFFQSDHARFLKELQLPSHMLAVGYLDPMICPRWACTDLEELAIEFYPGMGRNTTMVGTSVSSGSSSGGGGGPTSPTTRSAESTLVSASTGGPTTTTTISTSPLGGVAMMSSTLAMSRRVLSFIVTSFPHLRRLTLWRSCINLSDLAGGLCFLSRLPELESLTLKANHKHLWYWPRASDKPMEETPRWMLSQPTDEDRARGKSSLQVCRTVASLDEGGGLGYFDTPHGREMLWPFDSASAAATAAAAAAATTTTATTSGDHSRDQPAVSSLPSSSNNVSQRAQTAFPEEGCLWKNMQEIRIAVLDHTDNQEEYLANTCNILRSLRPDIKILDGSLEK